MSKHIKKQVIATGAVAGLGALVGTASADTIVYANGDQGAENHNLQAAISGNKNQAVNAEYDNYVAQLQSEYTFLKRGGETTDVSSELSKLKALEPTFKNLQALQARIVALQKQAGQAGTGVEVLTKRVATENELKAAVDQLKDNISRAEGVLAQSSTVSIDSSLTDLVREINKTIDQAMETGNHYDKIHRKAYESAQVGTIKSTDGDKAGLVVNTKQTTRTNLVTTTGETVVRPTQVATIADATRIRDEALAKIAETNKADEAQVVKAGTYKDNALTNIDAINQWLQSEQNRADTVQSEIDKNMSATKALTDTKDKAMKALDQAEQIIKTSSKSQKAIDKMLETVKQARAQLEASKVTQKVTATITEAQNADFGDIGRNPSDIKAVMDQKTKAIEGKVQEALQKLKASNQTAQGPIDAWAQDTNKQVSKFVEKLKAGKFLGQVDESWLSTRKIYQANVKGYQGFVKKALALTEEDTEGVLTKAGNVWKVKTGTPTPKAAAALYNDRSKQCQ